MRKILLSLAVCGTIMCAAQQVVVTNTTQLLKGVESNVYNPVISADGSKLIFTGENNRGLKLYDINDNVVTQISDAERAGFGAKISNDGKVYYVTQTTIDQLKYRSAMCYDIASKSTVTLVKNVRNVAVPAVLSNGGVMMKSTKGILNTAKSVKKQGISVYTEGSKVIVNNNGRERSFSPVESQAGYLWASLSPDCTKVLFFAAGKGAVVMSLDGKVLSMLGNYECPAWFNNDYVVAQNTKDDGHQFTSSQIMLLKADGSFKKELTAVTSMTMHPSASSETGKVVYNTIDGNLYMMELSINDK